VTWTIGLSYDEYSEADLTLNEVNPKIGMQWDVTQDLRLRLAAFRSLKPAVFASQTIQPIEIAGFNQFFDDARGAEGWLYGIGIDAHITDNLNGGIELSRRDWQEPIPQFGNDLVIRNIVRQERNVDTLRSYLYWILGPDWGLSIEPQYDVYDKENGAPRDTPRHARTFSLPIFARYFSPLGVFGSLGATAVYQDVARQETSSLAEGSDSFVIFDASAGFRFPQRRGVVSLEVRNVFDAPIKFQDESYRWYGDASTISPYFPERTIIARLSLSF